jgi:hypothetical protein
MITKWGEPTYGHNALMQRQHALSQPLHLRTVLADGLKAIFGLVALLLLLAGCDQPTPKMLVIAIDCTKSSFNDQEFLTTIRQGVNNIIMNLTEDDRLRVYLTGTEVRVLTPTLQVRNPKFIADTISENLDVCDDLGNRTRQGLREIADLLSRTPKMYKSIIVMITDENSGDDPELRAPLATRPQWPTQPPVLIIVGVDKEKQATFVKSLDGFLPVNSPLFIKPNQLNTEEISK